MQRQYRECSLVKVKGKGKGKTKGGAQKGAAHSMPGQTMLCVREGRESLLSMVSLARAESLVPMADASQQYNPMLEKAAWRLFGANKARRLCGRLRDGNDPSAPSEVIKQITQSPSLQYKTMDEIPNHRVASKPKSSPIGYSALTSVSIGGCDYPALLDSGASVSAIPEEVFHALLDMADQSGLPCDHQITL